MFPFLTLDYLQNRFVLDETDGRAARTFNQASTLGAVLDMVTDRQALLTSPVTSGNAFTMQRAHQCAQSANSNVAAWHGNIMPSQTRQSACKSWSVPRRQLHVSAGLQQRGCWRCWACCTRGRTWRS